VQEMTRLVSVLVVGLGAGAGVFAGFLRDLPSLDGLEAYQPSITTTLYTDQDEPFASFYEQRRSLVPLAKIPANLKQAVLAAKSLVYVDPARGATSGRTIAAR